MNYLETGIDGLRNLMGKEISGLRQEMHTNFRWSLGIMISMWVTIIFTS